MQSTTYPGDELQERGNTRLPQEARPFCLWAKACDLLSPQILGLTFAMTMYCQVVKADTYCA